MKFGIMVNGGPHMAPNPLHVKGFYIYNPSEEQYATQGYLPMIETPRPTTGEGGVQRRYAESWKNQDGKIVRVWTAIEEPELAPVKPTRENA